MLVTIPYKVQMRGGAANEGHEEWAKTTSGQSDGINMRFYFPINKPS